MARRSPLQLAAVAAAIAGAGAESHDVAGHARANGTLKAGFVASSRPFFGSAGGLRGGELSSGEQGALWIDEDGTPTRYYLPGARVVDDGKTVEYRPPHRFYLMKRPTTDYSDADNFYKVQLVGKTFTVDIDLRGVSCGCNVNFYLVDMPVAEAGRDRDHYCDAQCFDGLGCCAEFDMNEGNANVQQVTNHACTGDYGDHPDWRCHKWGQPMDKTHTRQFGQGTGTIDSSQPFTFSQEFRMEGGQLQVITTLKQGAKSVALQMGPDPQLQAMAAQGSLERGMAFVTGYWHDPHMNWMDGEACGGGEEHCSESPARISNWRITTNGGPAPPAPTPSPPAPTPSPPAPSPAPGGGDSCCWHACGQCAKPGAWCAQSMEACQGSCAGSWIACAGIAVDTPAADDVRVIV